VTQQELNQLLQETIGQLRAVGIPISRKIHPQVEVNTRAQRRLGCCTRRQGQYFIQVSARILETPQLLRQTLLHELLHTCYGCLNHGKRWKQYAQKVGEALGVEITRTAAMEGPVDPLRQEEVKYLLRCQSCGRVIPRKRRSKAVDHPERYRCPCGGKLELIQKNMIKRDCFLREIW
jgi:predicted SprT family Zn-dependent metalloprotease